MANGRLEIRLSDLLIGILIIVVVVQTVVQFESSSDIASKLVDLSARIERLIKITEGEQ